MSTYYKLSKEVTVANKTGLYLQWYTINYPLSNTAYWSIQEDKSNTKILLSGNVELPEDLVDRWGTDDSVIPKWMGENKIWEL